MAQKLTQLTRVTVTTAGTRVQASATSIISPVITIQADPANTGNIFVGDSSVSSTVAGIVLQKGVSITLSGPFLRNAQQELDVSDLWFDAATSGDKVYVGYLKNRT